MIQNNIKIAWRNISKNPVTAAINILGLSLGFASVVLILLFIRDELSYDQFHQHKDDIYRISWFSENPQTRTPHPMAQGLVRDFPEVESAVSITPIWGPGLTRRIFSIANPQNALKYDEKAILGVDSTFFDVFSFNLLKGNPKKVLRNVGGILISDQMAKKYFRDEDPLGKQLSINDNQFLAQVEGVFEKVPENSHFHFDFLVSYVTLKSIEDENSQFHTWHDFGHFNYIKLHPKTSPLALENKLMAWAAQFVGWDRDDLERLSKAQEGFKLQPLTDIHLKSNIRWELEANGHMGYVYIMSIAAIFILVMACVNFMNLSLGKSLDRVKEIGIRKASGASKTELIRQFLVESMLISVISLVIAGLMLEVGSSWLSGLFGKQLSLNYLEQPDLVIYFLAIFIFTGLVPGLYPAIYLSSLSLSGILRGKFGSGPRGQTIIKFLVVFQFTLALMLISGSIIIFSQLQFFQDKPLGFQKEHLLVIPVKSDEIRNKFLTLKGELKNIDGVKNVAGCSNVPGKQYNQHAAFLNEDPQNRIDISDWLVDVDIIDALKLQIIAGRGFSLDFATDSMASFVINQKAVESFGLENPVGTPITWELDEKYIEGKIIGIVQDFHFQSLHEPVRPILMTIRQDFNHAIVNIGHKNVTEIISKIEDVWTSFDHQHEFEYTFFDETIDQQYRAENNLGKAVNGFAVLAVMLACLGLLGIAKLSFAKKIKQIGIRKVMGAQPLGLIVLLIRDYSKLVIIAIFTGIPLCWLVMKNWLQNFEYRVAINPITFLVTGAFLLLVTWLTLGYLTYKTAKVNPADTLKDE
ncbi:ABC transporter permease [Fulvivirgaceae bacterium BMA12]|uniref:ABC transporter permease n=1 Tax=Agaribacillus aureus TaxID=3051825 RepID=A0ABT8L7W7_9BACT|nr:ABC transporter permease [Fulvivirgaceae bacterium BMA12]